MKILVFSDSHGKYKLMESVIERLQSTIDAVFFLGDGLNDLTYIRSHFPDVAVRGVIGNCDGAGFLSTGYQYEEILNLDGKRILLSHGHRQQVKYGVELYAKYAAEKNADIALFGHTHKPLFQYMPLQDDSMSQKPLWLCNPGAVLKRSYGILQFGDFGVSFHCPEID